MLLCLLLSLWLLLPVLPLILLFILLPYQLFIHSPISYSVAYSYQLFILLTQHPGNQLCSFVSSQETDSGVGTCSGHCCLHRQCSTW